MAWIVRLPLVSEGNRQVEIAGFALQGLALTKYRSGLQGCKRGLTRKLAG